MTRYFHNKRGRALYRIHEGKNEFYNFRTNAWEDCDNEEIFYYCDRIEISPEEAEDYIENYWSK